MTWADQQLIDCDIVMLGAKHLPFFAVLGPDLLELIDYFATYFEFVLS